MELSTPAILFGSISLLLLAYNNRFTTVAKFIRELYENKKHCNDDQINYQIPILRKRIWVIQRMQICGVIGFILCTGSLFALFFENQLVGKLFFTGSILCLLVSLLLVLWELSISTKALDIMLNDAQKFRK
ncbi:DUF2721 domain-containing protein [Polaribacter batillariae]|uniref:DUF2721 domain-containing protein n=1 Tax=Polaribacter batillariae TaxID=2808900 RepID=A0ABX7SXC2_9FLAO|nr:DUF2721 domain-containing protein [Polaribacter batillariae]QTD38904.1 DUF2721 domain-containing protein [Polaribacter batillariae]